ncbi:MAG: polyphosphate polymerase domain-containing protein [Anaerotignum sp.]|nr:polyphosphate polymerase domain-containing protein [Anaerotignum sp.]
MKRENNPLYRHELKYRINDLEKAVLIKRLHHLISLDANAKNGQYTIRSLYFDDICNSAYEDKVRGIADRKKYRIRIYNCSDQLIKLERKEKIDQYIKKEAVTLTREETEKLISGDFHFLEKRQEPVCRMFYLECLLNHMKPKVIVDYERIPYIYLPGDVRITFDMHVRTGLLSYDIFDSELPTLEVLSGGELILEVKYTEFLPEVIRNLLPMSSSNHMAYSKYVLCYEKKYGIR